ncbi:GNAT family N-acetyltransferase [Paracoccus mangrovi]|uniref:GNAT family N-acetyltransferase n=1 Tax=Paracoccus mangrovi TaxID=1715645 RepID=A0ABV7R573_9RHOB
MQSPAGDVISTAIRPALPEDLAAIQAIAEAAYRPYVARNGLEPAPLNDDYAARIRKRQIWIMVLEYAPGGVEHERPCGFVVLVEERDHLMLDNIAVDPLAQGRGHGRAMLEFAEGYAHWTGLPAIRLNTQEIMVENLVIYTGRGYLETHRVIEHGLPRIYMEKRF